MHMWENILKSQYADYLDEIAERKKYVKYNFYGMLNEDESKDLYDMLKLLEKEVFYRHFKSAASIMSKLDKMIKKLDDKYSDYNAQVFSMWKAILKDERFDAFRQNMSSMHEDMLRAEKGSVISRAESMIESLLDYKEDLMEKKENKRLDRFIDDNFPTRQIDSLIASLRKFKESMEKKLGV